MKLGRDAKGVVFAHKLFLIAGGPEQALIRVLTVVLAVLTAVGVAVLLLFD